MVMARTYRFFLVLLLVACFAAGGIRLSHAHPHVFIDSWVTVVFDEKGLAGFNIRWVFDDMFSSMMIMDFDVSKNGRFELPEIKDIEKCGFSNLKKFGYFVHVKIDKKTVQGKIRD